MSVRPTGHETELFSPGRKIGRYEVVRELGFGGMAAVYAVRLRSMANVEKLFAIKVLLPHLRKDKELIAMFLDEARIAVLLDHPNVTHVFELGEDAGTPYIVMEHLHGQSLSTLIKRAEERERRLSPDLFLYAMSEVALGLHAAHELTGPDRTPLEVVHRDVSPQNVHVAYDGRIRVMDFGIARARGRGTHTATGQIKGKFSYCSPEQITRPHEVDRRTDVWALGVMLWEHYARARLFREDDEPATLWNVVNKTVPRVRTVATDVPEAIDRLIARCLDREVEARPRTALEVAKALRAAADERAATSERLATEMRSLFQHEILEAQSPVRAQPAETTETTATRRVAERTAMATGPVTLVTRGEDEEPSRARPSRALPIAAMLALVGGVIGVVWWQAETPAAAPPTSVALAPAPIANELPDEAETAVAHVEPERREAALPEAMLPETMLPETMLPETMLPETVDEETVIDAVVEAVDGADPPREPRGRARRRHPRTSSPEPSAVQAPAPAASSTERPHSSGSLMPSPY